MAKPLVCWKCGAPLTDEPLPLSRRAECRQCRAELHVCRLCIHFDPRVSGQCREDRAETVSDKTRANFCEWFKPRADAFQPAGTDQAAQARAALAALFGETADTPAEPSPDPATVARQRLEDLFKP